MRDDFHIMLIDDSRADARIIMRALAEGCQPHRLTVVSNGKDAIEALTQVGEPLARLPRYPDLILLDLNLPGMDGEEVLKWIKTDPLLRVIPVVMFSTSYRDVDVDRTYRAGANTFIKKPDEYPRYREIVRRLLTYWNETALRPTVGRSS